MWRLQSAIVARNGCKRQSSTRTKAAFAAAAAAAAPTVPSPFAAAAAGAEAPRDDNLQPHYFILAPRRRTFATSSFGGGRGGRNNKNNNNPTGTLGAFERFRQQAAASRKQSKGDKNNRATSKSSHDDNEQQQQQPRHKTSSWHKHANRPQRREPSFSEKFLDPAAAGVLNKKHQSGIPKLAARKSKSKTAIHDDFPGKEAQQIMASHLQDQEVVLDEEDYHQSLHDVEAALQTLNAREEEKAEEEHGAVAASGAAVVDTQEEDDGSVQRRDNVNIVYQQEQLMQHTKQQLGDRVEFVTTDNTDTDDGYEVVKFDTSSLSRTKMDDYHRYMEEHYFDDFHAQYEDEQEEYEPFDENDFIDPDNHPDITKEKDGTYVLHYNPNEEGYGVAGEDDPNAEFEYDGSGAGSIEEDNAPMVRQRQQQRSRSDVDNMDVDLEERFFHPDVLDTDDPYYGPVPDEIVNQVRPLQEEGPNLEDFLEAVYQHPTKFAEVRRYNLPFESRREPKPIIPKTRRNPPQEWVEARKKFLYVSDLPSNIFGEEGEADYDNPVHRNALSALIADLLEVDPEDVYPANMTSAFVGFKERYVLPEVSEKLNERLQTSTVMTSPITISAYNGQDYGEFTRESPDCLVQLNNVPPHMTPTKLASELFTPDSDLRIVYGQLTVDKILMTSPSSALIRLDSAHHAETAVTSEAIALRLDELGSYPINYFHAKRELIPDGFTGPNKSKELKRLGPRLIVDGDVPTNDFFRSHAGVVQLRNLDDRVTKQDIANLLQPYSKRLRDVSGSVEWVTNLEGTRMRRAFVGFDGLGEAEAFLKAVSGRIKGLGSTPVVAKLVGDKKIPGFKSREARPERTEQELLDDLNNWEKYVDPKELEELEALGVNKMALDLAFRSLRFHNPTYGPMDQALRSETLVPEREAGEEYRETVREYIKTVKECVGTPENPGEIYKTLFMPGEEIDLSIFEYEKRRQARIKKRLGG